MSPSGLSLASFQTKLTVLYTSLTAIRGKSFIKNRLYPGTTVASVEMMMFELLRNGGPQGETPPSGSGRQEAGTFTTTTCVAMAVTQLKLPKRFVYQLYSKPT